MTDQDRRLLEELHHAVDEHLEYRAAPARRDHLFLKMVEAAKYLKRPLNTWDPSTAENWPDEYVNYQPPTYEWGPYWSFK